MSKRIRELESLRILPFGIRAGSAMVQETRYSLLSDFVLLVQLRLDDHASTMKIISRTLEQLVNNFRGRLDQLDNNFRGM